MQPQECFILLFVLGPLCRHTSGHTRRVFRSVLLTAAFVASVRLGCAATSSLVGPAIRVGSSAGSRSIPSLPTSEETGLHIATWVDSSGSGGTSGSHDRSLSAASNRWPNPLPP